MYHPLLQFPNRFPCYCFFRCILWSFLFAFPCNVRIPLAAILKPGVGGTTRWRTNSPVLGSSTSDFSMYSMPSTPGGYAGALAQQPPSPFSSDAWVDISGCIVLEGGPRRLGENVDFPVGTCGWFQWFCLEGWIIELYRTFWRKWFQWWFIFLRSIQEYANVQSISLVLLRQFASEKFLRNICPTKRPWNTFWFCCVMSWGHQTTTGTCSWPVSSRLSEGNSFIFIIQHVCPFNQNW